MNKEQIFALAEEADETAMQYLQCVGEYHPDYHSVRDEHFYHAAISAYKAELLKEVRSPIYQVCKSDSVSLSSAWIDVTEQTYNDADLYPEYGRRILYTSDQVAAAIIKATKPLEDQLAKAEHRVAAACAELADKMNPFPEPSAIGPEIRSGEWRKFVKETMK